MWRAVGDLTASWASLYANHAALRTFVEFAHVAPLVVGGGVAIAADRATFGALRLNDVERGRQLDMLARTHAIVIASLALTAISGLFLFAADTDTFVHSRVFWTKMALVLLLVVNGAVVWRAETRARGGDAAAWDMLGRTAVTSIALWLLTTLAGVALPNIG